MKALVKFEKGTEGLGIKEVPEPSPATGDLKVKVLAAGICGSDIHTYHDYGHGNRKIVMPRILGHEFVGQVCELGEGVTKFNVGDWIVCPPACYSCGECELCRHGLITLCHQRKSIGTHVDGAMAEYVLVPEKYALKLPDKVDNDEARKVYALAEPFCCCVRAIYEKADVKPGDVAVVTGPGPMGAMAGMLLRSRGAYVVMSGLEKDADRLAFAIKHGAADETVTNFEDLKNAVLARNPNGADITCDIAACAPSLRNCFELIKECGTHIQIGVFAKTIEIDLDELFSKEITYIPSNSTAVSSWKIGMALLEKGIVDIAPVMTLQLPLDKWKEGFEATISQSMGKVVLLP